MTIVGDGEVGPTELHKSKGHGGGIASPPRRHHTLLSLCLYCSMLRYHRVPLPYPRLEPTPVMDQRLAQKRIQHPVGHLLAHWTDLLGVCRLQGNSPSRERATPKALLGI